MKKNLFALMIACTAWPVVGHAENLLQVYRDGLKNDPQFQAAEAQMLATQQLVPISRGALLPQIGATGSIGQAHIAETFASVNDSFNQKTTQYALSANQIIFNYATWNQLKNASAQAKQAQAAYDAALQDLMMRIADAYFAVLRANDVLATTLAQKRSLAEQLRQTEEQFKVGLIAITGVDQVKASYDSTVALEISNKNNISDKLEELRAITGVLYTTLIGIDDIPLITPVPNDINAWVKVAAKQNYTLQASKFAMDAAKANISVQQAGHLPTVTASGSYNYVNQSDVEFNIGTTAPLTTQTTGISLNATLPVFSGGAVTAQTRQASYQYAQASAQMEQTYRTVLTQARESYLGVISGISQIKADKQSIMSNQSSLAATKAGYTVGTNTILDVLQQQSGLYNAQTNYTIDQYNYLINTLTLKQAAGTLSENDIKIINSWLKKKIDLSAYNFDVKNPAVTFSAEPSPNVATYPLPETKNTFDKPDIPAPNPMLSYPAPISTQPSTTPPVESTPTSPSPTNTTDMAIPTPTQPTTPSQPAPTSAATPEQTNTSNTTSPISTQPSTTTTTITIPPTTQSQPATSSTVTTPISTQPGTTTTIIIKPEAQPAPTPAPQSSTTQPAPAPTSPPPSVQNMLELPAPQITKKMTAQLS